MNLVVHAVQRFDKQFRLFEAFRVCGRVSEVIAHVCRHAISRSGKPAITWPIRFFLYRRDI